MMRRDLKSSNVLLTGDLTVLLTDFGTSRTYTKKVGRLTFNIGTTAWMAPEMLDADSGQYTEKVDVYGFGVVMWCVYVQGKGWGARGAF